MSFLAWFLIALAGWALIGAVIGLVVGKALSLNEREVPVVGDDWPAWDWPERSA